MFQRSLMAMFLLVSAAGCGMPAHEATEDQRHADLEWIFAKFDRNYAPLEWKEKNLGVKFDQVKAECLERNKLVKNNQEFRALAWECISKFQDAHTSGQQVGDVMPGKAEVAYLGFVTQRYLVEESVPADPAGDPTAKKVLTSEALRVKGLLPTTDKESFPLKEDDLILKADGEDIRTVVRREIGTYRDLGLESATLTAAANGFAIRNSLSVPVPKNKDITLLVRREKAEFEVTLPWTRKDLFEFAKEQRQAQLVKDGAKKKANDSESGSESEKKAPERPTKGVPGLMDLLLKQALTFAKKGDIEGFSNLKFLLRNSFRVLTGAERDAAERFVGTLMAEDAASDAPLALKKERTLPGVYAEVQNNSFPTAEVMYKGKRFLYVRIPSFSITDADVEAFGKLLLRYRDFAYEGLVLDLLDNGGGSLVHGGRLANMLSPKKIKWPQIQVRLNDGWVDSFESSALFATTDAERTWAGRVSEWLKEDLSKGQRLSRTFSTEALDPYASFNKLPTCQDSKEEKEVCLKEASKIVVLVNEMCASMCDIFASTIRDNKLGTIIGAKTMGAGGNVVMHAASPVSMIMLQQTESLIVDAAGNYLENMGVEPDITTNTVNDRQKLYSATLEKAFETLAQVPAATPAK